MRSVVVDQDYNLHAAMLARKRTIKAGKTHMRCPLKGVEATRKLPPFLFTFTLNRMCDIIKRDVGT
jgi:hypothetical protein